MHRPPPMTLVAHARAVIVLGLPLAGGHIAQMILHVTDTVMLGWYSVETLAAGVLGATGFFLIFVLGAGFAQAVMPLVAAATGRGEPAEVRRFARMGAWLSVLYGVLAYPLFWWSGALLRLLGQSPEIAALGEAYLRIAGIGLVPALLVMVLRSLLSALERAQVVLWTTIAAAVANAVLNWMLIFGNLGLPEMGIAGAALASVLVQIITLLLLASYAALAPRMAQYRLFLRMWRPDWPAFRQVFRLGWPIGMTGLSEGFLFSASSVMMGWIGTVELAAHGIAVEVTAIAFMLHVGISNAATVRTGRFLGAGDVTALRDGALAALGISFAVGLSVIVVYLTLADPMVRLFLNPHDPAADAIVAVGMVFVYVAALFQLADAGQVMALGLLRGLGDTRRPMLLTVFSYWFVGIPASYLLAFPAGLGGIGLWLGLVIGLATAASLLLWRFRRLLATLAQKGALR
jgi:MATE family multidrug resistance protein